MFDKIIKSRKNRWIASMVLLITMMTSIVGYQLLKSDGGQIKTYASGFRHGFKLTPTKYDAKGLGIDSQFILTSENDELTVEKIKEGLKVSEDITFKVSNELEGKLVEEGFVITLDKPLLKSHLYTFSYHQARWAFQTESKFEVLGFLPAHQAIEVPINSGIEVYFSHLGVELEDYFEITPKVNGKFENHGKVVAFVPKKLEEETLYTVTVKAGLPLPNSEEVLEQDYSFQFETASKDSNSYSQKGYFNIREFLKEYKSDEDISIPYNLHAYNDKGENTVETSIYRYQSMEDFKEAISEYTKVPSWSVFSQNKYDINQDGLEKIIDFKNEVDFNNYEKQGINVPVKLEAGFYLVDATWNGINSKTLIQVADFNYYSMETRTGNLLWIHDNEGPVNGASISLDNEVLGTTNEEGIAEYTAEDNETNFTLYTIEANNQKLLKISYPPYYTYENLYWRYFGTDRNLYQPDDAINFWGFIKERYTENSVDEVTVEIASQNWWWYYNMMPFANKEMPFESIKVPVENGFYNGQIEIPNLAPDHYELRVKIGDRLITTQYFQVDNYVKPDYKIEVENDKEAIFIGENINFTIATKFYEGTPVSNIPIQYNVNGIGFESNTGVSNINGEYVYTYRPTEQVVENREQVHGYFNASASLPETGEIYTDVGFRIFTRDMHMQVDTGLKDHIGSIKVNLNDIVLDRLNDGSAEDYNDYLGNPVGNHKVKANIYKNVWIKTEKGEEYDFINKVVRKRYDYHKETSLFKTIDMTTNENGFAETSLALPEIEDGYYHVELFTSDHENRSISQRNGFYKDWDYHPSDYEYYQLKANQESFDIKEEATIEIIDQNKKLATASEYLFITAQNGLLDYTNTSEAVLKTSFKEAYIPNVTLHGVIYNGKNYIQAGQLNMNFNRESNQLQITAKTDKEEYKPGDTATIDLEAKYYDKNTEKWMPVKDAMINISIVDEALFSLSEYNVDVMNSLFANVSDGVYATYISHSFGPSITLTYLEGYGARNGMFGKSMDTIEETAEMDLTMKATAKNDDGGATVRSDFKDTAIFKVLALDESGKGKISFTLPDNITSWRMVFSGISKELKAGSNTESLIVTLPYFLNTNLNKSYLVGDLPSIGVSSYGDALVEGEEITYKVACEEIDFEQVVTGKAFERVNIPLWKMEKGQYKIVIEGYSKDHGDALETIINVYDTYHQMEVVDYYIPAPGDKYQSNEAGMTKLVFTDTGKGRFIADLYGLSYTRGKRVEQKYVASVARDILENTFGLDVYNDDQVNIYDYQQENGLLSILPYSEGDLETTVKLLPLIKDRVNTSKIGLTLESMLYQSNASDQAMILYGLAILDYPVLLEIDELATEVNLRLKDQLYLGLAYAYSNDSYNANKIYTDIVENYGKTYETSGLIEYGKTKDDYLVYTTYTAMLAAALDKDETEKYFEYITANKYSEEVLMNGEILAIIMDEINRYESSEKVSVTYKYDGVKYEKELVNGWGSTMTIPSSKMDQFEIVSVEGDVSMAAIYLDQRITSKMDDDLSVSKKIINYSHPGQEISEGDIVKVEITWDIDGKAIDKYYSIIDFAPSGLVPLKSNRNMFDRNDLSGYSYRDVDGQKVTFHVSKNSNRHTVFYYARIASLGEYRGEGTIIQGNRVKDSVNVGNGVVVEIE